MEEFIAIRQSFPQHHLCKASTPFHWSRSIQILLFVKCVEKYVDVKQYTRTVQSYAADTRMVQENIPYAYGTYRTRTVCTICVWYEIRVRYTTSTWNSKARAP